MVRAASKKGKASGTKKPAASPAGEKTSADRPIRTAAKKTARKASRPEGKTAAPKSGKKTGTKPRVPATARTLTTASKSARVSRSASVASPVVAPEEIPFRLPSADPEIRRLLEDLIGFLEEKKLVQLRVMNLEEVNPYFCFFVIVTASSPLQLAGVAREVSKRFGSHLTNKKLRPVELESGWVIQDFVDIVLHIFLKEQRDYYNLEKLWGDAPTIYSSEEPRFRWPQSDRKTEG